MDVRCEKCSTEYELDEARLKPGGVTVKCTNCGHTFKVRKKEAAPAAPEVPATMAGMPRGPAPATPAPAAGAGAAASGERQWLIRLENGETRSCRELATLQQWILAGEVTRDALISRSGKTWKLLGDIVELGTYFTIADEAKQQRSRRESAKSALAKKGEEVPRQTLVGVGPVSSGSMALGDLDNEEIGDNDPTRAHNKPAPARAPSATDEVVIRTTAPHAAGAEPVAARRGGVPSQPASNVPSGVAATVPSMHHSQPAHAAQPSQPTHPSPVASQPAAPMPAGWPANPPATSSGVGASGPSGPMSGVPAAQHSMPWMVPASMDAGAAAGPSSGHSSGPAAGSGPAPVDGPMRGRLQQQSGDEPAFAGGRNGPRTPLASSQPFTGMARDSSSGTPSHPGVGANLGGFGPDDDHGPAVAPRGSRAGLWIAIASLVVIAGGFATVWLLVLRTPEPKPEATPDAPVAVLNPPPVIDAGAAVEPPPVIDAGATPTAPAAAAAGSAELAANVEARMNAAIAALADGASKDEAQTLAMRARLHTAIAQSLEDRAALALPSEKAAADKLRQKSKEAVLAAMPLAQRALKAAPTDASANLAMADLLRLQGKSARDLKRYLDAARAASPGAPDLAILDGLLLIKEGKLGDARALWTKADAGEAKLEQSGDVRLRFRSAVAALADGKAVDARAAVETVMAAQPEHEGAKVLLARLDQSVANTDPLPPEEGKDPQEGSGGSGSAGSSGSSGSSGSGISASDSFEKLVKKADELAEKSCTKAIPVYQAALDKNPTGIPALVGLGYCHIDTKQFSSANSRFRTVLALSSKNERALWGIAQAYQEQGLKAQAVEAYRNYLEVFPGSDPARRQIDRLGGGSDAPSGGGNNNGEPKPSGGGDTPTTTPSPETPAPTPPAGGAAGTAGESAQGSAQ
jgi:predicted Zn finger-like uncharacterized protein